MCEMISQLLTLVRRVWGVHLSYDDKSSTRRIESAGRPRTRATLDAYFEDRSALAASGDALLARSDLDAVDRIVPGSAMHSTRSAALTAAPCPARDRRARAALRDALLPFEQRPPCKDLGNRGRWAEPRTRGEHQEAPLTSMSTLDNAVCVVAPGTVASRRQGSAQGRHGALKAHRVAGDANR